MVRTRGEILRSSFSSKCSGHPHPPSFLSTERRGTDYLFLIRFRVTTYQYEDVKRFRVNETEKILQKKGDNYLFERSQRVFTESLSVHTYVCSHTWYPLFKVLILRPSCIEYSRKITYLSDYCKKILSDFQFMKGVKFD